MWKDSNTYADIMDMEYPLRSHDNVKHPRMDISERAKIFAPFAALKGHEESIEDTARNFYCKPLH